MAKKHIISTQKFAGVITTPKFVVRVGHAEFFFFICVTRSSVGLVWCVCGERGGGGGGGGFVVYQTHVYRIKKGAPSMWIVSAHEKSNN